MSPDFRRISMLIGILANPATLKFKADKALAVGNTLTNTDFWGNVLPSGTLVFKAGEPTKEITINVLARRDAGFAGEVNA